MIVEVTFKGNYKMDNDRLVIIHFYFYPSLFHHLDIYKKK